VREQLLAIDGVLVWVDPIHEGPTRAVLDAMLREVAATFWPMLVRLRLRGPRGTQNGLALLALALNLRRLAKLITHLPPS
jgi:hypothetical protein